MQIGDAFIGIHHRYIRVVSINRSNFRFYTGAGIGIEFIQIAQQVTEAVVYVHTGSRQLLTIFFKYRRKEYFYRVTKDDGVGNLHHGGFHVQREQYTFGFGIGHLLG